MTYPRTILTVAGVSIILLVTFVLPQLLKPKTSPKTNANLTFSLDLFDQ
jgi:type II secretory pathway component PulF